MKTLNYNYLNDLDNLKIFIDKNAIKACENILLQIFCGVCDVIYIKTLIDDIKNIVPHVNIIGTTTSGEILEGNIYEKSVVLSFSLFEKTQIKTYFIENLEDGSQSAIGLIEQFDKTKKPKVMISFIDGIPMNAEDYLKTFYQYDKDLVIAGGLAGDNGSFVETIVFTQDRVLTNGSVVALLYNDRLNITTKINFGWKSIGKTMTITKAIDNIVYEIDNMKAMDVYKKYLGEEIGSELPLAGAEFPLILQNKEVFISRTTLSIGENDSLIFAGRLKNGDKVKFGYGNLNIILNGSHKIFNEMMEIPIESIFIYSCMARKSFMGQDIEQELYPLSKIAPMSGFFTYGEFFSSSKRDTPELLNETMTILTLSESEEIKEKKYDKIKFTYKKNSKTLEALSHLISFTSDELEKINSTLENRIQEEVLKNQAQNRQLIEQSRLAQMGEMISMIAHQWRQPLSAISATSAIIKLKIKKGKLDEETTIILSNKIASYAQYLSTTIDDFREFFKPNKDKTTTTYDELIKDVLNIIEVSIINKNILIIQELKSDEEFVTYPNEIKQVILNLLKNAEEALLENQVKKPTIIISTEDNVLTISDNAGGVPTDIIDKIFNPYFSTKLDKNGTGLGLYMSKTIIEEHCGGKLSVSNNNENCVFKIELEKR